MQKIISLLKYHFLCQAQRKASTTRPSSLEKRILALTVALALGAAATAAAQAPTQTDSNGSSSRTPLKKDLEQSIKGTVTDKQSGSPLAGATVLLLDSLTSPIGAVTDENGRFRLENVPIGRKIIQVTYLGYTTVTRGNLMLLSGKELDVEVPMEELVTEIKAVEITDKDTKHQPLNQMATVSSRSFSIEEAGRYSGSFQDPARMAQNFAGVSGASDDRNDIIIRGNSPTGVLWRMEGIDIPSPNHFATLGTTGGPVSMLNINNLSNSDFLTSAFPADYGNALSGVFDLKLRNGNPDKREYLAQVGFNGFELGAEGPFKKGSRASYLANYRYSMLAVVSALGLEFGTGSSVPYYQDLTFKVNLPTQKAGTFTVFGLGGLSKIEFLGEDAGDNNLYTDNTQNSAFRSNTGVTGLSHTYFFDEKTYSRLVLALSGTANTGQVDSVIPGTGGDGYPVFGFINSQVKYSLNYKLNRKFNARNTATAGIIGDIYQIRVEDSSYTGSGYSSIRDYNGNAALVQGYANWQHRFSEAFTLTLGAHSQHFLLNNSHSIEPRLGLRYKFTARQSLSLGGGLHSQTQPLTVYFVKGPDNDPQGDYPNKDLDFTRALHGVLGYDLLITPQMRLKAETYFQRLYNVPVHNFPSSFSMLNAGRDFVLPDEMDLVNEGTGYNYGFELTLERFFSKGYYFLGTASLFQSRYEGSDGIERNTAFNGNYVFNGLAGKEFKLGKRTTLGFDTKVTYAGGARYTPYNIEASQTAGYGVLYWDQVNEGQFPEYFRADFKTTFRMNFNRWAQQFSVDLQNITNHQNVFQYGWNASTGNIGTTYQRGFFPDIQYKVFF
jgi:hypothetical protein